MLDITLYCNGVPQEINKTLLQTPKSRINPKADNSLIFQINKKT